MTNLTKIGGFYGPEKVFEAINKIRLSTEHAEVVKPPERCSELRREVFK